MLVCVRVVQAKRGIQTNGNPDAITDPRQLPHLALFAWMCVKRFLYEGEREYRDQMKIQMKQRKGNKHFRTKT